MSVKGNHLNQPSTEGKQEINISEEGKDSYVHKGINRTINRLKTARYP